MFANELEVMDRVVGNLEPIGAILQDIDGNVVNLTGKTIKFRMIKISDGSVKVDSEIAVVDADPTTGKVTYNPNAGDMDVAGKYAMYFVSTESPERRWPYDGANWVMNLRAENV